MVLAVQIKRFIRLLKKNIKLLLEGKLDYITSELDERFSLYLASKVDKDYFGWIKEANNGSSKDMLIDQMIHHPEFYKDGFYPGEIEELIISTNSIGYMEKTLKDPTLELTDYGRNSINNSIEIAKLEKAQYDSDLIISALDGDEELRKGGKNKRL